MSYNRRWSAKKLTSLDKDSDSWVLYYKNWTLNQASQDHYWFKYFQPSVPSDKVVIETLGLKESPAPRDGYADPAILSPIHLRHIVLAFRIWDDAYRFLGKSDDYPKLIADTDALLRNSKDLLEETQTMVALGCSAEDLYFYIHKESIG